MKFTKVKAVKSDSLKLVQLLTKILDKLGDRYSLAPYLQKFVNIFYQC